MFTYTDFTIRFVENGNIIDIQGKTWMDNIKMDLREIGWNGVCVYQSGSGYGPVEGSCEHGNDPSGSIQCWEVLEYLHNLRLLKKGSAP
jgi:hypothetical protein